MNDYIEPAIWHIVACLEKNSSIDIHPACYLSSISPIYPKSIYLQKKSFLYGYIAESDWCERFSLLLVSDYLWQAHYHFDIHTLHSSMTTTIYLIMSTSNFSFFLSVIMVYQYLRYSINTCTVLALSSFEWNDNYVL